MPGRNAFLHFLHFLHFPRNAPYKSGRTKNWIKVKCLQVARYEVVGYKNGATSLYLVKREGKDLLYVGKAGTGFTNSMILELARLLKPITLAKSPLSTMPDRKNKIDPREKRFGDDWASKPEPPTIAYWHRSNPPSVRFFSIC